VSGARFRGRRSSLRRADASQRNGRKSSLAIPAGIPDAARQLVRWQEGKVVLEPVPSPFCADGQTAFHEQVGQRRLPRLICRTFPLSSILLMFVSTGYWRAAKGVIRTYMTHLSFPEVCNRRSIRCGQRKYTARVFPRRKAASLRPRPPSTAYVTSFGFAPSADRRSIDASRKAPSRDRSTLGQELQPGPRKICRSGSMIRRAIGYRDNTSERLRSRCGVSEGKLPQK
jgi:hypothetical protein